MISQYESEMALRSFRAALNEIVSDAKQPEGRNACILNLTRNDNTELYLYAYSSAKGLSKSELQQLSDRGFPLVEDVPEQLRVYACGGMGQYHTEPRLINYFNARPGALENVKTALIISEIDCCTTCMKYTVDLFVKANPIMEVYTDEYGKNPGRNQLPRFTYQGPAPYQLDVQNF